jgi:hypothetical protein
MIFARRLRNLAFLFALALLTNAKSAQASFVCVDAFYDVSDLLARARGARDQTQEEIAQAHGSLNKLIEVEKGLPFRDSVSKTNRPAKDLLLKEPILKIESLGGGYNQTLLVHLKNGSRAVFKPFSGQENLKKKKRIWKNMIAFNRETSAVRIIEDWLGNAESRARGLSPLTVPETIEVGLFFEGKNFGYGSLQLFAEGTRPLDTIESEAPGTIASLRRHPGWRQTEARIRVIDFLLGNPDRLENPGLEIPHFETANFGNLLIKGDLGHDGKMTISLIDNAWGRPGPAEFDARFLPDSREIPEDLKPHLRHFDAARFRKEFADQLPQEGIEDFLRRLEVVRKLL